MIYLTVKWFFWCSFFFGLGDASVRPFSCLHMVFSSLFLSHIYLLFLLWLKSLCTVSYWLQLVVCPLSCSEFWFLIWRSVSLCRYDYSGYGASTGKVSIVLLASFIALPVEFFLLTSVDGAHMRSHVGVMYAPHMGRSLLRIINLSLYPDHLEIRIVNANHNPIMLKSRISIPF